MVDRRHTFLWLGQGEYLPSGSVSAQQALRAIPANRFQMKLPEGQRDSAREAPLGRNQREAAHSGFGSAVTSESITFSGSALLGLDGQRVSYAQGQPEAGVAARSLSITACLPKTFLELPTRPASGGPCRRPSRIRGRRRPRKSPSTCRCASAPATTFGLGRLAGLL